MKVRYKEVEFRCFMVVREDDVSNSDIEKTRRDMEMMVQMNLGLNKPVRVDISETYDIDE